jgi:hypothetical protein
MDPLSISAGIIAVLQALSSSAKVAKELWNAPQEPKELTEELEQVAVVAENINGLTVSHQFDSVDVTLLGPAPQQLLNNQLACCLIGRPIGPSYTLV